MEAWVVSVHCKSYAAWSRRLRRERQLGSSNRPSLKSGSALGAQHDLSRKQEFTWNGGSTADTILTSMDP